MYMLRHIRDFFSVSFKIDEYQPDNLNMDDSDDDDKQEANTRLTGADKIVLTCVGTGFVNFNKGNI